MSPDIPDGWITREWPDDEPKAVFYPFDGSPPIEVELGPLEDGEKRSFQDIVDTIAEIRALRDLPEAGRG